MSDKQEMFNIQNIPKDMNSDELKAYLLNNIALELYKTGKFSLGYCANLSSMSYAEFMKYLADNNISTLEYTKEELEDMLNNA